MRLQVYYRGADGRYISLIVSAPLPASTTWAQAAITTPALPVGATGISAGFSLRAVGTYTMDDFTLTDSDQTAPAATLTAPTDSATVSGNTVALTANATDAGGDGVGGGRGGGGALSVIPSTVQSSWSAFSKFTQVRKLAVNVPAGTTVKTTCTAKNKRLQRKRCPYKSRSVTTTFARAKLDLKKPFGKLKLPVKTKITITITNRNFIGNVFKYTIRKRVLPSSKTLCLPAGAGSPGKCV